MTYLERSGDKSCQPNKRELKIVAFHTVQRSFSAQGVLKPHTQKERRLEKARKVMHENGSRGNVKKGENQLEYFNPTVFYCSRAK